MSGSATPQLPGSATLAGELPFAEVLEQLPDAMTLSVAVRDDAGHAVDMRLVYMNAMARAGQPDPEASLGSLCSELWPQMVENGSFGECMRVLDTGTAVTGEFMWTEGDSYQPAGYDYKATRIGADLLLWVLRDSTPRLRAAHALRESESRFRASYEGAPVGMCEFGSDHRWSSVNRTLARMLEIPEAELTGSAFAHVLADGEPPVGREELLGVERGVLDREVFERTLSGARGTRLRVLISVAATGQGSFIAHVQDITEAHRARKQLAHAATHDPLTGLGNRSLLMQELERAAEEPQRKTVVVYLDLDRFKDVNDTHGHAVGDALLISVARRLRHAVRDRDAVVRLGGDEFVVVGDAVDEPGAEALVDRLSQVLSEPVVLGGIAVHAPASVGAAVSADGDHEALLRRADAALYESKKRQKPVVDLG